MRLIYQVPGRPRDVLQLHPGQRLDSRDPRIVSGQEFEVSDALAEQLLGEVPHVKAAPGDKDNPIVATTTVTKTPPSRPRARADTKK